MTEGLPHHLRLMADESDARWRAGPIANYSAKRAAWAARVMREAADEIDRLLDVIARKAPTE